MSLSTLIAACYSAACRPPQSGGTGGSLPRGSAAAVAAQAARVAGGAKAVKPTKPKGGSERTAGLGVPVHNVTEFTRKISAAIAAEPALQGMKSAQQRKDEVEAEYRQAVFKHESEWRRKLREGTDSADTGLRVRTAYQDAARQFPKSEREAVERSMREAMVKILDDPAFVPQTEIEKAASTIMGTRLEKNGGRTSQVSTYFHYTLSDGTKVYLGAAHFVDPYPAKKQPSLDEPAITPEFEAATRRIGGMVREEVVARTQRIVDASPQPDWDGIEAEKQRLLASGKEVFFSVTNGEVRVKQIGKSTSETEADPEIAAFKRMIEGSGITSDIRALHEAGARSRAEQQAMREVLAEVRPMGGRFDGTPNHRTPPHYAWSDHRSSHEQVMLATRLIPSDWIDISNARGRINFKSTKGRAHYRDWDSEITLSGKTSVALHELMHRAEYTVPGLAQLERVFLDRRAAGETPTRLNQIVPGSKYSDDEVTTPDQLFNPYAGKVYKDGAREIMSMGMEYLLSQGIGRVGSGNAPDADYADLVLGALSVLGRNT